MQGVWFAWGSQEEMDSGGLVARAARAGSLPGFTRGSPAWILARFSSDFQAAKEVTLMSGVGKLDRGSVRVSVY